MRWRGIVPVLLVLAGCADEIPEDVSAEMDARRIEAEPPPADTLPSASRVSELLESAPAGGYADWLADVMSGLDSVSTDAATDRGDALHAVQELVARRFEYLVQFYGPQGAAHAGMALAQSIERAGQALQDLMRMLADTQADAARIEAGVTAARTALRDVDAQARAAGLPPTAPRTTTSGD
jgi:hypothetical protein